MNRSRLSKCGTGLVLIACIGVLALCGASFAADMALPFTRHGAKWELVCRFGMIRFDNAPQRNQEMDNQAAADIQSRIVWEREHDRLHKITEQAPYGPQYNAAREQLVAWEKAFGAQWIPGPHPAITPSADHRLALAPWAAVAALVLSAWITLRVVRFKKRFDGKRWWWARGLASPLMGIASMLVFIALTAVWIRSYHGPIPFRFCTADAVYGVIFSRGRMIFTEPPVDAGRRNPSARANVAAMRKEDVTWILNPPGPMRTPQGVTRIFIIRAIIKEDTPSATLAHSQDTETLRSTLRALHDSDRFLIAHAVLTDRAQRQPPALPPAMYPIFWFNAIYNGLPLSLTPEQRHAREEMEIPSPDYSLAQRAAVINKWHQIHDRKSRPFPMWPITFFAAALAAPLPIALVRRLNRRASGSCLKCGYNLTGNTSGICPECGTAVLKMQDPTVL